MTLLFRNTITLDEVQALSYQTKRKAQEKNFKNEETKTKLGHGDFQIISIAISIVSVDFMVDFGGAITNISALSGGVYLNGEGSSIEIIVNLFHHITAEIRRTLIVRCI